MSELETQWHDLEQGSLEWHMFRSSHLNASETGAVMEVNPWFPKNQKELNAIRTGQAVVEENFAMGRGKRYEDEAREWINEQLGADFQPAVVSRGQFGASLDGVASMAETADTILEIKVPMDPAKLVKSIADGDVPQHYWFQMAQQAWCVPSAVNLVFLVYDPDAGRGWFSKMPVEGLRQTFTGEVQPAWEAFLNTDHGELYIDQTDNEEWCSAAWLYSQAREARVDAEKEIKLSQLKKSEDAAKKALLELCDPHGINRAHGINVHFSEVEPQIRKGYVQRRVTGKWED
jgi:putative phage-type endonuclease